MTGSGNDFVMVDGRSTTPADWTMEDMRRLCARGTGVGADGVVFVGPGGESGAVRMVYFNSDGSRAAMCGNAALCSTRLAVMLGLGNPAGMRLETDAGVYESRYSAGAQRAELHLAPVEPPTQPDLRLAGGELRSAFATVGVPHLVVQVEDLEAIDLLGRGRALRFDPELAPSGANVNFVAATRQPSTWAMRTYERGVEAETLACGTGAVAAACILREWGQSELPVTVITRTGLPLSIRATRGRHGRYDDVWLEGEAELVFRGVLSA
jgi:diaminopimelate epimerase